MTTTISHSEPTPPTIQRETKCPGCGKLFAVDWYDFDYSQNEALRASIERILAMQHCQPCILKREADAMDRRHRGRSLRAYSTTYGRGWVPEDARNVTFENSNRDYENRTPQMEDAFDWGRHWSPSSNDRWAFLQGPPGTGKSYFARCLLNRAMSFGRVAYEVDADTLQKWALGWVEGDKHIANLLEADIVLIEEVGLCEWVEGGVKGLRRIVDNAYRTGKTLVFTSNLTPEELFPIFQTACKKNVSVYTSMKDRMRAFKRLTFDGRSLRQVAV